MRYLIDSDFLFGLFVDEDVHHSIASKILKKIKKNKVRLIVLNLVIQETATVISGKRSQREACLFLEKFTNLSIKIVNVDEDIETMAWNIFKKQTKKRTSFIDCTNLATLEKYKFDGILSFDEFYPKNIRVTT